VTYMLVALSEGAAIYIHISHNLAFWYAGGMAGIKWLQIKIVAPWLIAGLIGALMLSRSITLLSLREEKYQFLLPAPALAGALLLIVVDTLARWILQPTEIPTRIVVAVIGAPYFLFLLAKSKM
jgi:iron complex transport system permease protein